MNNKQLIRSSRQIKNNTSNTHDGKFVDHCTYVLESDGDLEEGLSSEAGSVAGHLRLGKLKEIDIGNLNPESVRVELYATEVDGGPATHHPNSTILAINGGSSSIRFAVFQGDASLRRSLYGKIDRIGLEDASFGFHDLIKNMNCSQALNASDYASAIKFLIDWLDDRIGLQTISAIGHRIVHGMHRTTPDVVTKELLEDLRKTTPCDLQHLPFEIELIEAFRVRVPQLLQIVCFDTGFHASMPRVGALLYVTATTGYGLLVSNLASSQVTAVLLAAILSMMPTMQFSGMFQPVSTLEGAARVMGTMWPAAYYLHISVGTFTKGLSAAALVPDLIKLAIFPPVFWFLCVILLKKQEN